METDSDFIQRMKTIMKREDFRLGIGDIASATGVSQRQLRYWEKKGYIQPDEGSEGHRHRKYAYRTLIKVSMIQSYVESGYTLGMAVEKSSQHEEMSNAVRQLLVDRLADFKSVDNGYELDFGCVQGTAKEKHLIAIIKKGESSEFKLLKREAE